MKLNNPEIMKIQKAKKILKEIKKRGFEAFIVGGAVRDIILNTSINDIDIITNGRYEEIKNFLICKKKNIKYGVFQIIFEKEKFEITTYRKEGPYLDYRNPNFVQFITDVKEDLKRRDFTINSFLMDENGKIIDYINAYHDLHQKQIKTIGNPETKLKEDALRIMRLFTLQAKTNFDIEKETKKSVINNISLIHKIKSQDILKEIKKITKQKFYQKAFLSLKQTNAISFLKEFKNSILFTIEANWTKITPELFIELSLILDPKIIKSFQFNKKEKTKFQKILSLYEHLIKKDN
ncbi:MAG: CCA tRNA nucleotidyltransferase [Phytoplasma sp.]|uniref:CCA tRNA nucleotidyltransferase n=1 Tax=Phytoplasma sp. TaxID=2155 RepID=UPI002B410A2D|nr:CCA tRNA nucleotidyltransferase [Phytoplasma sp.]WRH06692.1 MAG: CCA tRNA nucleotidyltransferase [Phytoplasma sp.]